MTIHRQNAAQKILVPAPHCPPALMPAPSAAVRPERGRCHHPQAPPAQARLVSYVAPAGALVLAGILERQADELKAAYAPWLQREVADSEDGWILMTATSPAMAS